MFRVRQVAETTGPLNDRVVSAVQEMLRERFPGLSAYEVESLPERLRDSLKHSLSALLFVADDRRGRLRGFALVSHAADVGFCLLDFVAGGGALSNSGVGGAICERVPQAAQGLRAVGLFFGCLPDDANACSKPDYAKTSAARMRFCERADLLTASIHGHARFAYPFFSGLAEERGNGAGLAGNLNTPLAESIHGARCRTALKPAVQAVARFGPKYLIVCLGLDTAKQDPTGSWGLQPEDLERNGRMIGELGLPTPVVQEGGYRTTALGACAQSFFVGLAGIGTAPTGGEK